MTKYNKTNIMKNAWVFFRTNRYGTFANCLRRAWADAKAEKNVKDEHGEATKTYYAWTLFGREVIHGQKAVAKITVTDPRTKNGTRVIAFFTEAQTCELGTQPAKAV